MKKIAPTLKELAPTFCHFLLTLTFVFLIASTGFLFGTLFLPLDLFLSDLLLGVF